MKELITIQSELKAPKNQFNKFGGYKYRNCEDILEAVKPLLAKNKCTLTISDDIVAVGTRIYVKATCTLRNEKGEEVTTSALARESESKKGMDDSQITGASSSYARKYALNGLFCIDDTKDSDATNDHGVQKTVTKPAPQQVSLTEDELKIVAKANGCNSIQGLGNYYKELVAENKWTNNLAISFTQIKKAKGWN